MLEHTEAKIVWPAMYWAMRDVPLMELLLAKEPMFDFNAWNVADADPSQNTVVLAAVADFSGPEVLPVVKYLVENDGVYIDLGIANVVGSNCIPLLEVSTIYDKYLSCKIFYLIVISYTNTGHKKLVVRVER